MTKLRNIGYMRFGSKILQGFAGFLPPSPLLSPSPLSGSRGQKMRTHREGAEFYIWGGGLPPGRGAAGSLQGPLRKINLFLFIYRSLPPPCRAVGPLPPLCRAVGV